MILLRRAKSVVGLDLGSSVVKAVELSLLGSEPVLTGFGRAEIPPGGSLAEAVSEALATLRGRTKRCVSGVGGQSTVVRYISMLPMTHEELLQAVRFEADKFLPFDADEVVLDCQQLSAPVSADGESDGSKVPVLVAACRRQLIEEQVRVIEGAGLVPIAVDLDLFALANAWDLCGLQEEDIALEPGVPQRARALIDIGASRTSINVLRGGETCFSREIAIGGSDMTHAVARRLGVEFFEAEAIKRAGDVHEVEVGASIAPLLEDLANEIALSIDYVEHHEGVEVNELLLSGGGSLVNGMASSIEQATSRPTRVWDPLEGLRVNAESLDVEELEAWAPSLVVAMGLAARVRA
jgi:type IV pilus assembly protein PilM